MSQTGESYSIRMEGPEDKVYSLKYDLESKLGLRLSKSGIRIGSVVLGMKDGVMDDDEPLSAYGVKNGSTIYFQREQMKTKGSSLRSGTAGSSQPSKVINKRKRE